MCVERERTAFQTGQAHQQGLRVAEPSAGEQHAGPGEAAAQGTGRGMWWRVRPGTDLEHSLPRGVGHGCVWEAPLAESEAPEGKSPGSLDRGCEVVEAAPYSE